MKNLWIANERVSWENICLFILLSGKMIHQFLWISDNFWIGKKHEIVWQQILCVED